VLAGLAEVEESTQVGELDDCFEDVRERAVVENRHVEDGTIGGIKIVGEEC
jgi:hypothetical protein